MTYLSLNDEEEGASYMRVTDGALTAEFRRLRLPLGTGLLGLVAQAGARDTRPPARSVPVDLPGTTYLAGSSRLWGGGGTAARASLVTASQLAASRGWRASGSRPTSTRSLRARRPPGARASTELRRGPPRGAA